MDIIKACLGEIYYFIGMHRRINIDVGRKG